MMLVEDFRKDNAGSIAIRTLIVSYMDSLGRCLGAESHERTDEQPGF